MMIAAVASATACTLLDEPLAGNAPAEAKETVVLLHGLGRSNSAMWQLAGRLEEAGYRVERIGYRSLQDTPTEIISDISEQISACCPGNSKRLHFVGHSLGGLLIRAYLDKTEVANLGHVVLMGSPNTGTEIVDSYRKKWWFRFLGPTAQKLGTGDDNFPGTLGPPRYPLGVIAGKSSAYGNGHMIPGDDDGLVSVNSTKVDGMTDFVIVKASHSAIRRDETVANHVLNFLRAGRFGTAG